jgi:integrase
MKYVQHQLGHASIKMTMDTYTHLLPEVNEQYVATLDNLINFEDEPVRKFGT